MNKGCGMKCAANPCQACASSSLFLLPLLQSTTKGTHLPGGLDEMRGARCREPHAPPVSLLIARMCCGCFPHSLPLEAGGRATTSARSRRSPATRFQRQRVKNPFKTQARTGSHGQGVSRSDNLCSQCAEDGSPLERAQSEAASARISRAKQRHPEPAERSNAPQPGQTR